MRDQFVIGRVFHGGERQKTRVIPEFSCEACLLLGLIRLPCHAGHEEQRLTASVKRAGDIRCRFENGTKKPSIPYFELRGVNPNCQTTGSRSSVVPGQRTLMPVGKPSVTCQRKWMCRNHHTLLQSCAESDVRFHIYLPLGSKRRICYAC